MNLRRDESRDFWEVGVMNPSTRTKWKQLPLPVRAGEGRGEGIRA